MPPEPAIDWSAQPAQFRTYHEPALERDEIRHGLILNALAQVNSGKPIDLRCWTLGGPGECAIKMGHHAIVLGALAEDQCRRLADLTARMDYPGVVGPEMTARWFTDRAGELGIKFLEPVPQQIYSITDKPRFPGAGDLRDQLGSGMRRSSRIGWWLFTAKPSRRISFRLAKNSNGLRAKTGFCSGSRTANPCRWRESFVA